MAASGAKSGQEGGRAPQALGARSAGELRSISDYAWEFLRRNPDYRADFLRSAAGARGEEGGALDPRWGLLFPADPASPPGSAEVYWDPNVAPGLVIPLAVNHSAAGRPAPRLTPASAPRHAGEDLHLQMGGGLQLLLRGEARPEGRLVVVLALDEDFGLRVRAVQALHRAVSGGRAPRSRLTRAQRARLDHCLQALDGALERQSYRTIAQTLFGSGVVQRETWKTSSARAVTIRLVRSGKALMRGGYLKLLRGGL